MVIKFSSPEPVGTLKALSCAHNFYLSFFNFNSIILSAPYGSFICSTYGLNKWPVVVLKCPLFAGFVKIFFGPILVLPLSSLGGKTTFVS